MNPNFYKRIVILSGLMTFPLAIGAMGMPNALAMPTPEEAPPTSTSAHDLLESPPGNTTDAANPTSDLVAQDVTPGRTTRSGPSYIGVGGNIGFGGETALGEGNFTILSKIGLTRNFSARPAVIVGNDPTILLPLTADFPIAPIDDDVDFDVAPYVGGGLAISTGDDSVTRALVTGGIDVPLADQVTATANVNVAFFDDTEVGLVLGVGYNF